MRMLVIGSCTKSKQDHDCPVNLRLTEADFGEVGRLRAREQVLTKWIRPAAEMYTGRQHTQMMDGVKLLRARFGDNSCHVGIVSAGYGLLKEQTPIAPYDITFQGMGKPLIRARGEMLGIPDSVRRVLTGYVVVFLLLGDDYLLSVRPPLAPLGGQKLIAFGSPRIRQVPGADVVIVPAGKEAKEEFHDPYRTLKGRMFFQMARGLVRDPEMWSKLLCDRTPQTVLALMRKGSRTI